MKAEFSFHLKIKITGEHVNCSNPAVGKKTPADMPNTGALTGILYLSTTAFHRHGSEVTLYH